MRRLPLILGVLAILLLAGFFLFNRYIYNEKQANPDEVSTPYRGTLTGEYVCLPPVEGSRPEASQCTSALKTDQGEFYVIDFNLMSQEMPDLQEGDRFSASGVITPIENLSTDHWRTYPVAIEGIFSITDSVRRL